MIQDADTPSRVARFSRGALALLAAVTLVMVALSLWHTVGTLGLRNAWGDTGRYLRASQVFSMPTEREALYPIVLRLVKEVAPKAYRFGGVQAMQVAAVMIGAAYLAWSFARAAGWRLPAWALGAVAVVVACEPAINHFEMTILTDSFAGSLSMIAIAGLVAFGYDTDDRRRKWHGLACGAAFFLLGILRPEKAFMNAAFLAGLITIGVTLAWWNARRSNARMLESEPAPPHSVRAFVHSCIRALEPWPRWSLLAALILAFCIPVAIVGKLVTPRNKGKYPSMYDPRMLVLTRVHLQSFGDIYKQLDKRTRIMFSNHDAARIDRHRANLNLLIAARLREHPEFRGPIVEDIIRTTWDEIPEKVLTQFAFDAGSYLLPAAGFYAELALPRKDEKLADFSRHTRMMIQRHVAQRGWFPQGAVDVWLTTGAVWWIVAIGGIVVVVGANAFAGLRAKRGGGVRPVIVMLALFHFWAIFPFLFLHNQFIVRYGLPSYCILATAIPTMLLLAAGFRSPVASTTTTAATDRATVADAAPPLLSGVPA